jgi:hypothetical protein
MPPVPAHAPRAPALPARVQAPPPSLRLLAEVARVIQRAAAGPPPGGSRPASNPRGEAMP